jgi:hypothetical protein
MKAAKKRAKHARKMRRLREVWKHEAQAAAGLDCVDVARQRKAYERSRPRDALGRYLSKDQAHEAVAPGAKYAWTRYALP